jgi:uncharacterized protein YbaP (TraB family)
MSRVFTAAALLALASIATPALAQPAQPSLAELAARRSATPSRHLVWRVARDGRTVAYLVGSIHLLTQYAYPLPPIFDTIWAETRVLVEEVDFGEAADSSTAAGAAAGALLPEGQTLKTLLDAATYARVTEKAVSAGMPMVLLDRMKPWLVAMTLMVPELQHAGFDPAKGLDRHFFERAKTDGRPVRGLETTAYQLERMNGLPLGLQVDMLKAYLDDMDQQVQSLQALVRGWRTGDVAALEALLLKEFRDSPEVYQRLLVERNRNWVPKISECAAAQPCMVVVGGAHLLGPDSVVALLTRAGFTVEQQ